MSSLSDFGAGSKPKRVTTYTFGTGTHIPTVDGARCLIRRQGSGAGGTFAGGGGGGGGAGAMVETMERVPIAGIAYSVGAVSPSSTDGASTRVGNIVADGGKSSGRGGNTSSFDSVTGDIGSMPGVSGGSGGSPGSSNNGGAPGFSKVGSNNGQATGAANCSGGGDSFYGRGGNGRAGVGDAATGYGAGGGGGTTAGGTGKGGYIEIWDFGA